MLELFPLKISGGLRSHTGKVVSKIIKTPDSREMFFRPVSAGSFLGSQLSSQKGAMRWRCFSGLPHCVFQRRKSVFREFYGS